MNNLKIDAIVVICALMLVYSFLSLLFWGGAVFLCLYVFPYILPDDLGNIHLAGPP